MKTPHRRRVLRLIFVAVSVLLVGRVTIAGESGGVFCDETREECEKRCHSEADRAYANCRGKRSAKLLLRKYDWEVALIEREHLECKRAADDVCLSCLDGCADRPSKSANAALPDDLPVYRGKPLLGCSHGSPASPPSNAWNPTGGEQQDDR